MSTGAGGIGYLVQWRRAGVGIVKDHKIFVGFLAVLLVGLWGAYTWLDRPYVGPYLVGFVTGFGALCAALPALMEETPVFKWTAALVGGVCVGLGTWYTATDLDERLRAQTRLNDAMVTSLGAMTPGDRDPVVRSFAQTLQRLFDQNQYAGVHDLADLTKRIYPDNGHALYYEGEYWRIEKNVENMRGAFKHYFAQAEAKPESRTGKRPECYERASGYCAERTAYISHMMANDAYRAAGTASVESEKIEWLKRASAFARDAIALHRCGFEKTQTLLASHDIERLAAEALGRANVTVPRAVVTDCNF